MDNKNNNNSSYCDAQSLNFGTSLFNSENLTNPKNNKTVNNSISNNNPKIQDVKNISDVPQNNPTNKNDFDFAIDQPKPQPAQVERKVSNRAVNINVLQQNAKPLTNMSNSKGNVLGKSGGKDDSDSKSINKTVNNMSNLNSGNKNIKGSGDIINPDSSNKQISLKSQGNERNTKNQTNSNIDSSNVNNNNSINNKNTSKNINPDHLKNSNINQSNLNINSNVNKDSLNNSSNMENPVNSNSKNFGHSKQGGEYNNTNLNKNKPNVNQNRVNKNISQEGNIENNMNTNSAGNKTNHNLLSKLSNQSGVNNQNKAQPKGNFNELDFLLDDPKSVPINTQQRLNPVKIDIKKQKEEEEKKKMMDYQKKLSQGDTTRKQMPDINPTSQFVDQISLNKRIQEENMQKSSGGVDNTFSNKSIEQNQSDQINRDRNVYTKNLINPNDQNKKQTGRDPFNPYSLNSINTKEGQNPLQYDKKENNYDLLYAEVKESQNKEDKEGLEDQFNKLLEYQKNSLKDYREALLKLKKQKREENINSIFGKAGEELNEKEKKRLEMRKALADKLKKQNSLV